MTFVLTKLKINKEGERLENFDVMILDGKKTKEDLDIKIRDVICC